MGKDVVFIHQQSLGEKKRYKIGFTWGRRLYLRYRWRRLQGEVAGEKSRSCNPLWMPSFHRELNQLPGLSDAHHVDGHCMPSFTCVKTVSSAPCPQRTASHDQLPDHDHHPLAAQLTIFCLEASLSLCKEFHMNNDHVNSPRDM